MGQYLKVLAKKKLSSKSMLYSKGLLIQAFFISDLNNKLCAADPGHQLIQCLVSRL